MRDKEATPSDVRAGDAAEAAGPPEDESDAVASNASNYGGSALADKSIEDRVLHDD